MCRMSHVTRHMSCVTYNMSHKIYIIFLQSGQASRLRVCYQWGLPRLVFEQSDGVSRSRVCYKRGLPSLVFLRLCSGRAVSASVINRHGVAGAVLQTPLSLTDQVRE